MGGERLARAAADYGRVEAAIRYLEERAVEQPRLEAVAAAVGLSPYHFQRLFRRWAGVSPKRFLQFLTAEHAKRLLRESRSTLEVTYEVGLSSPSRLHDLIVGVEAVTPGELKRAGAGLVIRHGVVPSPFGECLLGITERGICHLSFLRDDGARPAVRRLAAEWPEAKLREAPRDAAALARRIFARRRDGGPARVDVVLKGTNFQLKVWRALLDVPPGRVTSYGDLAERVGAPGGARAVGGAVGSNPVAFLIPCHRVILGSGAFGYYGGGPARKKAILAWEAARHGDRDGGSRAAPPL